MLGPALGGVLQPGVQDTPHRHAGSVHARSPAPRCTSQELQAFKDRAKARVLTDMWTLHLTVQ
eukprot:2698661-Alexandrium_andersonii.AAC.1